MTSSTRPATMTRRLRELLARPQALMAPGAADALTARLVARQGFEAQSCRFFSCHNHHSSGAVVNTRCIASRH